MISLLVVVTGLSTAGAAAAGGDPPAAGGDARAAGPTVSCHPAAGPAAAVRRPDVVIGDLALMGAKRTPRSQRRFGRDAYNGHGYKIPISLPTGTSATLAVPMRLRRRVGLVYTRPAQRRAWRRGVRGANRVVRFNSCSDEDGDGDGDGARSGWPGGIVVDRPRCAVLIVRLHSGAEPIRRRVPLGRRCRAA